MILSVKLLDFKLENKLIEIDVINNGIRNLILLFMFSNDIYFIMEILYKYNNINNNIIILLNTFILNKINNLLLHLHYYHSQYILYVLPNLPNTFQHR